MTSRHDSIVRLLARFFRVAGALVHSEPRIFDTVRLRPDLEVILPDGVLLIDVTLCILTFQSGDCPGYC